MEDQKQVQLDYAKGLSWYIKDPKFWPTVLTLSLYTLSCIFIIPIFFVVPVMAGYSVAMIRQIQQGNYEILEVNNSYWNDGIKLFLLSSAVSLALGVVITIFSFGGVLLISLLGGDRHSGATVGITIIMQLIGYVFQMVFSLVFPFLIVLAYAIYAKTGDFGSIFSIENYKTMWRTNQWNLVIAYLLYTVVVSALATVGMFACCIGILPAMAASTFIMAGVFGQLSAEGVA